MSRVAEWSPYTTYIVGDVVNYVGIRYTATAININTPPLPATPIWVGVPSSTGVIITLSNSDITTYPTFVSATSGNLPVLVDSDFTYNPQRGDLSINDTVKIQSLISGERVAIGAEAGLTAQSASAVAVGALAGQTTQGLNAVAVGVLAGTATQGNYAVAVGNASGSTNQGTNAVAVGVGAGFSGQGASSVAIGQQAGETNQHANSIVINASGVALDSNGANRLFVKPVRNVSFADALSYDSTTGEVGYNATINATNTAITATSTNATFYPTFVSATTGNLPQLVDTTLTYNPSTDTLTVANVAGLASNATQVQANNTNANSIHYLTFVDTNITGQKLLQDTTGLECNPNDNSITATSFLGTATNSTNVATTASNVNATVYPTFVSATTGNLPINVDTGFTYNPLLGNLTIADTLKLQHSLSGGSVGVGYQAGLTTQGDNSVAVGILSGNTNQSYNAVAVGVGAGQTSQGASAVAIGANAGFTSQGVSAVAIGNQAGDTSQGATAVAIGVLSGVTSQGAECVAIGVNAGNDLQNTGAVAIGFECGQTSQGISPSPPFIPSGSAVAIGYQCGKLNQKLQAIAIGELSGETGQGTGAIAMGLRAGQTAQTQYALAMGYECGRTNQGQQAIAIGYGNGSTNQGTGAIAFGNFCGQGTQGNYAIAIGYNTGQTTQASQAVAVGSQAGQTNQGANAVAIGRDAGRGTTSGQGTNAIAIGNLAGSASQTAGSIAINASGVALNPTVAGCFIRPLRGLVASTAVYYNTGTFELSYLTSSATTKNTIEELKEDTSVVYGLAPKTYLYNEDPEAGQQIGFIAEEVAGVHKKFATYNEPNGSPVAIDYNTIVVFLVAEMKKLRQRIAQLESK